MEVRAFYTNLVSHWEPRIQCPLMSSHSESWVLQLGLAGEVFCEHPLWAEDTVWAERRAGVLRCCLLHFASGNSSCVWEPPVTSLALLRAGVLRAVWLFMSPDSQWGALPYMPSGHIRRVEEAERNQGEAGSMCIVNGFWIIQCQKLFLKGRGFFCAHAEIIPEISFPHKPSRSKTNTWRNVASLFCPP